MLLEDARTFACLIPGCPEVGAEATAAVCGPHFASAPGPARARFLATWRRVASLRDIWRDGERYDAVVASGRYLKLAHATACAEEALDAAARRLTLAVVAAQGQPAGLSERLRA